MTFDAADFAFPVALKLLDGSTREVAVDLYHFHDHFSTATKDTDWDALDAAGKLAVYQGVVAGFFGVPAEQFPGGMAYKVTRAAMDRFDDLKKKESAEPPST